MSLHHSKIKIAALAAIVMLLAFSAAACAQETEKKAAAAIGALLVQQYHPETLDVTVSNGGSFFYGLATGAVIENMRVDTIELEALLKALPAEISVQKKYELADMIHFSKGRIVLLEKDVNSYFVHNFDDIKGFTELKCDFAPSGFTASGTYTAKFILNFRVKLKATGVAALRKDGIYLEDTKFFIGGVRQPDALGSQIMKQINPLLDFKDDIPFPVSFKTLTMTDTRVVATGNPKCTFSGETWHYKK